MEEQLEFEVRRLVSYLAYRGCEVLTPFPCVLVPVRNERTGMVAGIPAEKSMIQREAIYWICLKLGVNMPDEFVRYQQMMDAAMPENFDVSTIL